VAKVEYNTPEPGSVPINNDQVQAALVEAEHDKRTNKSQLIEMLRLIWERRKTLPEHAMSSPINHHDFYTLIEILYEILKETP